MVCCVASLVCMFVCDFVFSVFVIDCVLLCGMCLFCIVCVVCLCV